MSLKSGKIATFALIATLSLAGARLASAEDTSKDDKKFVADSGEGSLAEVQMGKLALKNSTNKDVRMFAQKMVHDHTMLITTMKPFAMKMGVPAPTTDKFDRSIKDEYERLSGKKGEEFDKDYINTMVDDHHKDLADFNKERDSTADPRLKAAVSKGATVIQGHTEMIEGIAKKYNLPVNK